jgi:hypothetical protein
VKFEQRAAVAPESFVPRDVRWRPDVLYDSRPEPVGRGIDLSGDEWYMVIDDLGGGIVICEFSSWPALDADGRFAFDGRPWRLGRPLSEVQALVDRFRAANGQPAPDRPLRVGDVFALRGPRRGARSLRAVTAVLDVSAAARTAAKAALYGAVAESMEESRVATVALESTAPPPPIRKGDFDVRQQRTLPPGEARI